MSLLLTKDTELFLEMRVTFLVLPTRNWFLMSSVLKLSEKQRILTNTKNNILFGRAAIYRDLDSHYENESLNTNVIYKVLEGLFRTHIRLV